MKKVLVLLIIIFCFGMLACNEEVKTYQIIFKNGDEIIKTLDVDEGSSLSKDEFPELPSGAISWSVVEDLDGIDKNIEITAILGQSLRNINYDLTGYDEVTLGVTSQVVEADGEYTLYIPMVVNDKLFKFNFWKIKGTDTEFPNTGVITEDVTLVPDIERIAYVITYDLSGYSWLSVPSLTQIVKVGESYTLYEPTVGDSDYKFKYWKQKGSTEKYDETQQLNCNITLIPVLKSVWIGPY